MEEKKMIRIVDGRGIAKYVTEDIANNVGFMKKYGFRIQEIPKEVVKEPVKPEPVKATIPVEETKEPIAPTEFPTEAPDMFENPVAPVKEAKTRKPRTVKKTTKK